MSIHWNAHLAMFGHGSWDHVLASMQWIFMIYFVAINLTYLLLNYISAYQIVRYMREYRANYLPPGLRDYQPPVSIVLPAHNEEKSVVASVHSLLKTDYPLF